MLAELTSVEHTPWPSFGRSGWVFSTAKLSQPVLVKSKLLRNDSVMYFCERSRTIPPSRTDFLGRWEDEVKSDVTELKGPVHILPDPVGVELVGSLCTSLEVTNSELSLSSTVRPLRRCSLELMVGGA
eukprot:TRINITY_DN1953_c0_g1_i2.p2 TRINITY_DN1953_c0_g1~~TRINITY_DN1953_c0_g1_i2.p2  ORF type:complete len:128 (-),score=0.25 TRINITY_DN1953_c0_g1_i2:409-792(-)